MGIQVFLVQMPFAAQEPFIGIAQICGYLKKHKYSVDVLDVSIDLFHRHKDREPTLWMEDTQVLWNNRQFVEEFLDKERSWIEQRYVDAIVPFDKVLVGFSVTSESLLASLWMARLIKSCRYDAFVVFGGEVFTGSPVNVRSEVVAALNTGDVDAIVVGDGEETLGDLLGRLKDGRSVEECKGLWLRNGEGKPVLTGQRRPVCLDDLPFADYSDFDLDLYETKRINNHSLVLMASRGCVRSCTFCGHWVYWPGFRQMSGDRIYAEIKHQRRVMPTLAHGDSNMKFYDLLVNGDMKALSRLCDLLISDSQPPLEWREANAVVRPEMTYEMCQKLYQAGCRWLIVGLESGSQRVLDLMRKEQTVKQMKETLRNIDRAGLKVRGNFMFGHPGETEEDFEQTLNFLTEMWPYIHRVYPSYTMTHLDGMLERNSKSLGVDENNRHTLYWESQDKSIDYLVRLDRLRRFRERAISLGAALDGGTELPWDAYVAFCLAGYYRHKGNEGEALKQFKKYREIDPANNYVAGQIKELEQRALSDA